MSRREQPRWDQMTPKQRGYLLFKEVDKNTRAVAKLASAIAYLSEEGVEVSSEAPVLFNAYDEVLQARRVLRSALEAEVKASRGVRG